MGDRHLLLLHVAASTPAERQAAIEALRVDCVTEYAFAAAFKEGYQKTRLSAPGSCWLTSPDPQTCQLTERGVERLARSEAVQLG